MLRIYSFIVETLRKIAPLAREIARHDPDLGRQLRKASSSILLNTAEGHGSLGGNVRARYRTALGSAYEARACLDAAEAFGYLELDAAMRDDLDRIAATLYRLIA